jgi:hypothetical protein
VEEKVLCALEIGVGIILAFTAWSFAVPYFSGMNATPNA